MPTTKIGLGRIIATANLPAKRLGGIATNINKNHITKNRIPPTFSHFHATSKAHNKKIEGSEWMKKPPNANKLKPSSNTSKENKVKNTMNIMARILAAQ